MQGKLIIIKTDGTQTVTPLDAAPDLDMLSKAVGGYIEIVPYLDGFASGDYVGPCVAFCNEEGKIDGLPGNPIATMLWGNEMLAKGYINSLDQLNDHLVGDVAFVCGDRELLEAL